MKLYARDFTKLTEEELRLWEDIKKREIVKETNSFPIRRSLFREYPKAGRHFLSLFPNNYLDIEELKQNDKLIHLKERYKTVLEKKTTSERELLGHIKNTQSYFIIGSILKTNYNFGHHKAFIIPEFMLGNSYKVDYLLIGKSSGGYEFVFVELESPFGNITLGDGELGVAFRKGIKQVNDWEEWLESNYQSLNETFQKYKHPDMQLPDEFLRLDKTRIHFAVVAGRRADFSDRTYRLKRQYEETRNITLLHYDNLYDSAKSVIGQASY
jgi:hypothetical protein